MTGDDTQRIDFLRDSRGRIARITGVQVGQSEAESTVYRYDAEGRLTQIRRLTSADSSMAIAYDDQGKPFTDPISATLGTASSWLGNSTANQWTGNLESTAITTLAFTIRESELAATVHAPGAQGAVILALETDLPANATLDITGAIVIPQGDFVPGVGTATFNGKQTRLVRITEAGTHLIRISGTSETNAAASVRLSIAGDLNRDGQVDGADSQAWAQAAAGSDLIGDINGDGQVNSADRQVLYANIGFKANQAPTAATTLPEIKTHTDLATRVALADEANPVATDLEGDQIFWRVLGSTHGTASFDATGQALQFTPEAGYAGLASITVQADDGYTSSAPIELTVNVSGAKLLGLHLAALPTLRAGEATTLHATADFADEQNVAISDGHYLTVSQADLAPMGGAGQSVLEIDDSRDLLRAKASGPALVIVTRTDTDGRLIKAVASINTQAAPRRFDPNATEDEGEAPEAMVVQPDVYPGTLTLVPGGSRQLKVHLLDPNSGEQTDISQPNPTAHSGTRYISSDERIATVSDSGRITALREGQITLSVVHLASSEDEFGNVIEQVIGQSDIALNVEIAQITDVDPDTATPAGITIAADHGGAVQAATGETVLIGAGALQEDTAVSIQRIALADLETETGMAMPEPGILQTLGAFRLDLGAASTTVPVQLSITLQDTSGVQVGDEVLFLRRGTAPDINGDPQDKWWILDNGFVGTDADGNLVARTASPPYNGVSASGDLICVKTTIDRNTGAVTVVGGGLNLYALQAGSLAIGAGAVLAAGGLSGAGAALAIFGMIGQAGSIYAIDMSFAGAYKVQEVQKSLINGNVTLTMPPADTTGSATNNASTPKITKVEMLASGKVRLTLESMKPVVSQGMTALTAKLRFWISPDALTVDSTGHATSDLWSGNTCQQNGMEMWQQLLDVNVTADTNTVDLDIPDNVALGLHTLTVQRMTNVNLADPANAQWIANGDATSVKVEAQTNFGVVTLGNKVQLYRDGALIKELDYLDKDGNKEFVGGAKTDQIAFSADNRLMFIAGMKGEIHVLDTATMKLVSTVSVGSTANLSSLAVAGNWLYVAEGGYYDAAGTNRLLRMNIDPESSGFMQVQQINLPPEVSGKNAPYGYVDLAITQGRYLSVTASRQSLGISPGRPTADAGNVFIIDLDKTTESKGRLDATGTSAILSVVFPAGQGKGAQYVTSAGVTGNTLRLLVTDPQDSGGGLATITIDLAEDGTFKGKPTYKALPMTGALPGNDRYKGKYQLNIQRAQAPVITTVNGSEYALVADYFFDFLDPGYYLDMLDGKQAGGKIGIVKDPFGTAEYLGATTPIIDANFSRLQVSDDGKALWADIRYWPTIDDAPPPSGMLVWKLDELIAAAEKNSLVKQNTWRPLPIDREGTQAVVTPTKFNLNEGPGITSGWMFGMARSQIIKGVLPPATELNTIRYGDVSRVDLIKLIKEQAPEYATVDSKAFQGFNSNTIQIERGLLVKDGQTIVSAERDQKDQDKSLPATRPASEESYKAGTLNQSGIVFIAPEITDAMERSLRQGINLDDCYDGTITINLTGLTIGSHQMRDGEVIQVKIRASDFGSAAGRVFFGDRDLKNPGYSAFKLSGAVGIGQTNNPLDVFRVEQRLRYLGFPAMGAPDEGSTAAPTLAHNVIQDFKVDGQWTQREGLAAYLFSDVVTYSAGQRQLETPAPRKSGGAMLEAGRGAYFNALYATAKSFTIKANGTFIDHVLIQESKNAWGEYVYTSDPGTFTDWLNAYNAPHWMNVYQSIQKTGLKVTSGMTPGKEELYGVSWIRDLIVASQYADPRLQPGSIRFNGMTDANEGQTPFMHGTHDLGMAFDLGVSNYIDKDGAQKSVADTANSQNAATIKALPTVDWSVAKADEYAGYLVNSTVPLNNQQAALRNFLSIYALTQSDGQAKLNGKVLNTTAADLFGGLISKVNIGGAGDNQNPYPSINAILNKLGSIGSSPVQGHNSHFHIYFAPPAPEVLPSNLVADEAIAGSATSPDNANAQDLLDYALTLITGEELMFTMDVPVVPAQETPIVLVQADATAGATSQPNYVFTVCKETESTGDPMSAMQGVDPSGMLGVYIENRDGRVINFASIKPILLQNTTHGKLNRHVAPNGQVYFMYDPTPKYTGNDRAVFLAEFEGKVYKIVVNLVVSPTVGESPLLEGEKPVCPPPKLIKVTKPSFDANGYDLNAISVSIFDLAGAAVGQSNANGITLDTNAAGYNWFIDSTPADNSEFLPTANPNEWIAKAGSEAAGKMDMLSVLLHEYGHALGINHSSDPNDFMGTTLTPGVRRLPSAEELALMAQLAGEIKGDMTADGNTPDSPQSPLPSLPLGSVLGVVLLGRLRRTDYGSWTNTVDSASLTPQYDIAANPTFTNSQLQAADGWSTTGNVAIGNGAAVLTETATSQTRLNQVFVVGEHDRFLSFTLSNIALDDQTAAPDDAFEAALLDANTGLSLLGGTGLSHNDAFLNLQADGSEHAASGITSIRNADGSRTYLVDLAGIPAGTAVNLSFDLLGFGQGAAATSSHLTIRDLRIGVPQTTDDSATLTEDTPTTIAALANDLNAQQPGFAAIIVDAPAHGQITINADGTFSFAPEKDWHGEDHFSYKLSDGHVDSNLAIVSLTVTPVNDAPVAAHDAANVGEDGTLASNGNLLTNDSDVDSGTVLTVAAPGDYVGAYGTLILTQDGSYSYAQANDSAIVQALRAGEIVSDVFAYAATDGITSTPATLTVTITGTNDGPLTANDAASVGEDGTLLASGNLLANDSDVDTGAVLTVAEPGDYVGAYGTLTLLQDGSYSYTLANDSSVVQALCAGEIVSDVFAYAASDGIASTPATLTIQITGANDGPQAQGDAGQAREDGGPVVLSAEALLANDSDADLGDSKTLVAVTDSAAGAQVRLIDGQVVYDVASLFQNLKEGETTTDSFSYTMVDGEGATSTATVTMTIVGSNDAPVASPIAATLLEDGSITLNLLAGASDVDGDALDVSVGAAQHGSLTRNADGSYTYRPQADYNGEDSFSYGVSDGQLDSAQAMVRLTITAVNDAPVAQDAAATLLEDGRVTLALMNQASDVDGDTLSFRIVDQPAHGTLTLNADNTVSYVPAPDWSGEDVFSYLVNDGQADSNVATVRLVVNPVADAPTLVITDLAGPGREVFRTGWESIRDKNSTSTLVQDKELEGWTLITRPDPSSGGSNGFEIWRSGDKMMDAGNKLRTVSAASGNGNNWLELNNAGGDMHQTLGIERSIDTLAGATYTLSLDLAGRLGYSGDYTRIGILVDGQRIGGDASTSPATALDWQTQTFQFTGKGGKQTIRIVSEATKWDKNGRGMMLDDIALTETLPANTGLEDSAIRISAISAGLKDRDGSETLALSIEALPVGATLTDGSRTFTSTQNATTANVTGWNLGNLYLIPPKDFNGSLTLTVVATATEKANGNQACSTADLMVTVLPVNDAPLAQNAGYAVKEGSSVRIDFASLIGDVDSNILTLTLGKPKQGILLRNADGTYTYTPKRGYSGTERFSYTVSDGTLSTTATITVVVSGKSDGDEDDRDGHCARLVVQSGYGEDRDDDRGQGGGFVVVNQPQGSVAINTATSTAPAIKVDWQGSAPNRDKVVDDGWAKDYFVKRTEPKSLAELTGLTVWLKK